MKTRSILWNLVVAAIILTSCDKDNLILTPTGEMSTKEFSYENYNQIDISHQFDVFVTFSDSKEEIRIEAHEEIHPYLIVRKQGNTLQIKFDRNLNIRSNATPKVYITTKEINTYEASGEVHIELLNELIAEQLEIDMSGEASFLANLDIETTKLHLSGEAQVLLSGVSEHLEIDASGVVKVLDYELQTQHFTCDLSGSSEVQVSVDQSMNIVASGVSRIRYKGDPTINKRKLSGDAEIIKVN